MKSNDKGAGSSLVSDDVSRAWLAALGKWTGGLSPQAFGGAWLNVLARMASAPGRQAAVARSALHKSLALAQFDFVLQRAIPGTLLLVSLTLSAGPAISRRMAA